MWLVGFNWGGKIIGGISQMVKILLEDSEVHMSVFRNANNLIHSTTGPAVIHASGTKEWYVNGRRHREDGPAIEFANGGMEWYIDSKRHRVDGPAVIQKNGDECWYKNGAIHRTNGPAVVKKDLTEWYVDGELHRGDGPAVEINTTDSSKRIDWYWQGVNLPEKTVLLHAKYQDIISIIPTLQTEGVTKILSDGKLLHHPKDPAVEWSVGTKEWWFGGKRHRDDGPSITFVNGDELYFYYGTPSSKELLASRRIAFQVKNTSPILMPTTKSLTTVDAPSATTENNEESKKKKEIKPWPDDPEEIVLYDEIYAPMKEILEQGYTLSRKNNWKFDYSGYDIGKAEKGMVPSMRLQFTEKVLRVEKEKHKRSLMDVVMRAMFTMGIEQGRRMAFQEQKPAKELQKTLESYRDSNNSTRYQLARAKAVIKVKDENQFATPAEIDILISNEMNCTRQLRVEEIKKEIALDPTLNCFTQRVKKKKKMSNLLALALTLDVNIFSTEDWSLLLKDAGSTLSEWKLFCKKKKFNKFVE